MCVCCVYAFGGRPRWLVLEGKQKENDPKRKTCPYTILSALVALVELLHVLFCGSDQSGRFASMIMAQCGHALRRNEGCPFSCP